MSRTAEKYLPVLLAGAAVAVYLKWFPGFLIPENVKELLAAAISIGAILAGLLGNAMAILFSIDGKAVIQGLRKTGHFDGLVNYLLGAIFWSSLMAVLSGVGLLVDVKPKELPNPVAASVWFFATVASIVAYGRVINLFSRILRSRD